MTASELLATLCRSSEHKGEPACSALAELSEDESWVLVREACRTDNSQECQDFRRHQGGVLMYDLKSDVWSAEWEGRPHELEFDVAGVPTLRLRRGQAKPLKVLVTSISPLTYSARPGTPKEDDLSIISDLRTFLGFAGTGLQGLIRTLSATDPVGALASARAALQTASETQALAGEKAKGSTTKRSQSSLRDPCADVLPDVEPVAVFLRSRRDQFTKADAAVRELDTQLEALADLKSRFVDAAQNAEDGDRVPASAVTADVPVLTNAYTPLDEAARAVDRQTAALTECQPLLAAYTSLVGATADAAVVTALADAVLTTEGCIDDTDDLPSKKALRNALQRNAGTLREFATKCEPKLSRALQLQRDLVKPSVDRLFNAGAVENQVWQAVEKARAGKKEVLAGADVLERQTKKAGRYVWNGELIREIAVTRQNPELPWSKVQTHSIVIKAESPYLKELTLAHGTEEKREYKLESATGQILGYGVGVILTRLSESTWNVVTDPVTKAKVIAESSRETRGGDLAAFLTYRFLEHWPHRRHVQPTIDFGVGITSDRPAFFLGGGLEILRAARVGCGWTIQRVTRLAKVQPDPITSTDEIVTDTGFDKRHWYISLTFALDSLSLFKKP